ncbi:MAG: hypothetical protein LBQ66_04385 [Planctomycetaceae bacterium]|jgi:hypothetical protein|nr:hypothetical protein [Planctomycetaceae bacterium]
MTDGSAGKIETIPLRRGDQIEIDKLQTMTKPDLNWYDLLSDDVNPLVVRDVRRFLRGKAILWIFAVVSILPLCALMYSFLFTTIGADWSLQYFAKSNVTWILFYVVFCLMLFGILSVLSSVYCDRITDEMFLLVPLTPRRIMSAYTRFMTIVFLATLAIASPQLVLVLGACVSDIPDISARVFFILAGAFFAMRMLMFIMVSIIVNTKHEMGFYFIGVLFFIIISLVSIMLTGIVEVKVSIDSYQDVVAAIVYYVLIGGIYGQVGYVLALYNLRNPMVFFLQALFVQLYVYGVVTVCVIILIATVNGFFWA